jgi:hypothetical protein
MPADSHGAGKTGSPSASAAGGTSFYDADGNYLRVGGPDIDQILVSDRP